MTQRRKKNVKGDATAIVVAAGAGRRLGRTEKSFVKLGGKPLLFYSLKALELSDRVGRIVLVVRRNALQRCRRLVSRSRFDKVEAIVAGGARRQDSVEKGLCFCGDAPYVLVHDAARPFLSTPLIARTLAASRKSGAAIAALPVSDTVKRSRGDFVVETLARENLWLAQTPQAFARTVIERAFERWPHQRSATDDALMVEWLGKRVRLVSGDSFNIKITFPSDLLIAESLLRMRPEPWKGGA